MRKRPRLRIVMAEVKDIDGAKCPTDQYRAVVLQGGKVLYRSGGCHYALEAARLGRDWMERNCGC